MQKTIYSLGALREVLVPGVPIGYRRSQRRC